MALFLVVCGILLLTKSRNLNNMMRGKSSNEISIKNNNKIIK